MTTTTPPAAALPAAPTALRIHQFAGLAPGPKLIVLGAVHGNEVCGTRAIERILAELDAGTLTITRGSVTFVPIVNPLAYQKGQRQGDRNLNRNLEVTSKPKDFEDHVECPVPAAGRRRRAARPALLPHPRPALRYDRPAG